MLIEPSLLCLLSHFLSTLDAVANILWREEGNTTRTEKNSECMCALVSVKTPSLRRPATGYLHSAGCFSFSRSIQKNHKVCFLCGKTSLNPVFFFFLIPLLPCRLICFLIVVFLIPQTANIQTHTREFIQTKAEEQYGSCQRNNFVVPSYIQKDPHNFRQLTLFYVNPLEAHQKRTKVWVQPAESC